MEESDDQIGQEDNLRTRNASIISCLGTASRCKMMLASRIPWMIRGSRAGIVRNVRRFGQNIDLEKKERLSCSLQLL
jgi:hypothetical protein